MKKIFIILSIIVTISSCNKNSELINDLKVKSLSLENIISTKNEELKLLKSDKLKKEKTIIELNNQIESTKNNISYNQITKDNRLDEFLVFDNLSLLPNGFIKTEGYLSNLKEITTSESMDISGVKETFTTIYNQDGIIFYITEKDCVLNNYLKDVIDENNYFERDEYGNLGFTVNINEKDRKLLLPIEGIKQVKVLLTLHRLTSFNSDNVVPYATVTLY